MKLTKEEWTKWQAWIARIYEDLQEIADDQDTAVKFDGIVIENLDWIRSNEGLWFCDFVRRSHATAAIMAIRRHAEINDDAISMMRLLDQFAKCADQFTYDFYLEQFPLKRTPDGQVEDYPWQSWTFRVFSSNTTNLDGAMIATDMEETIALAARATTVATKKIAHLDRVGFQGTAVTYKEVRDIVDHFNRLVCKYHTLLTSEHLDSLTATKVFNWMQVFRQPLVTPKQQTTPQQGE